MKKIFAILLLLLLVCALCACTSKDNTVLAGDWVTPGTPNYIYNYTFSEDGTGSWQVSIGGGTTGGEFTYEYNSESGRLIMTRDNGYIDHFDVAVTPHAMLLSTLNEDGSVLTTNALIKVAP